jgi:DNA-binding NtrC family response regulator
MAKATILFADNNLDFLKTRAEFLEQEGYLVIPAADPTESRRKLELGGIDLAIVDIRLRNDDDDKDVSGLTLAKEVARSVPKIILTGFPSYEAVREALKSQSDGLEAAVDFVAKQEGPEALLNAIEKALRLEIPKIETSESAESQKAEEFVVWKRWRSIFALITLLLAFGSGIMATIYGDPKWLLGTVAMAVLAVGLMGISRYQ